MSKYAVNKRAKYDYHILETFEAGLVLTGQEVKSVRSGNVSLKGSYVTIQRGEAFLVNAHISAYKHAGIISSYEPTRKRKLLLHKSEIGTLIGKLKQKGLTLVPISLYNKNRRVKLEFGLGKGKKAFDKREDIKQKDAKRKMQRVMRDAMNG